MKKKIYSFILILLLGGLASARAQNPDSLAHHCNASFSESANLLQASFHAVDSDGNVLHYWYFGDTSQQGPCHCATVSHTYGAAGTYFVVHFVRDSLGRCYDSSAQVITVVSAPPCEISFSAMRDSTNGHLYNLSAYVPGPSQPMDTVSWTINGVFAGVGVNLYNQYLPSGSSTICARLTRASGCFAQQCQVINVDSLAACVISPYFSYQADSSNPDQISFVPYPNSDSLHYHWDFGDSTSSLAKDPVHLYARAGAYYVTLKVTGYSNADSCTVQTSQVIYVNNVTPPPPVDSCSAVFTYTRDPQRSNEITFSLQDTLTYDSLRWTATYYTDTTHQIYLGGTNPVTYTFPDTGSYIISLTVYRHSCIASTSQSVRIDSTGGTNGLICAYPNPAANESYIDLTLPRSSTVLITVFNSQGKQLLTKVVAGFKGPNHIGIQTAGLPKGIYYVRIQYGNIVKQSKIQKL